MRFANICTHDLPVQPMHVRQVAKFITDPSSKSYFPCQIERQLHYDQSLFIKTCITSFIIAVISSFGMLYQDTSSCQWCDCFVLIMICSSNALVCKKMSTRTPSCSTYLFCTFYQSKAFICAALISFSIWFK